MGNAGKDRDHHLRLEAPDHPHGVLHHRILRPQAQGLVERACVAEVVGAGEELAAAVHRARRQQLAAAQESQPHSELRTDEVLPALAAAEREIGRLAAHAARDEGDERGVLVVRMRADHQQALVDGELGERPVHRRYAARGGRLERRGSQLGCGGQRQAEKEEQEREVLHESSRHRGLQIGRGV
jgi:hypothetical protein